MDEDLTRNYLRWREAEEAGRDDEADAEFGGVFRPAVPEQTVSVRFTARTMDAVAAAAARDARWTRRTRRILVPVAAASVAAIAYFGAGLMASAVSTTVVRLLDLLVGGVVGVVSTVQAGADVWTVVANLGRAATAFIANPAVTVTILALQAIAITALVALQRLLGPDGESLR